MDGTTGQFLVLIYYTTNFFGMIKKATEVYFMEVFFFIEITSFVFPGDICPEGNYCPTGSNWPTPCENGTYMNHTGGVECYICPEGYYCVNRDKADPCREGYYCPEGTGADLQPCPLGDFANTTGLGREDQCTRCTGTQLRRH